MITPAHIKADVVDIRKLASATQRDMVTDANVHYWVFYPNFTLLNYAGGRQPSTYQITEYPRYWTKAAKAKT